ncbi:MAG: hypothetical protein ACTSU0_11880 [Alphaproteobacteria bacterium]
MSQVFYDDGGPATGGHKVMLATTAYDRPDASYTFSIQRSRRALAEAGIDSAYLLLEGNCHVDDARNVVCQQFLLSDCDDLVFLDADVSWEPEHIVELCRHDRDLVGGIYPYRRADGSATRGMPVVMIEGVYHADQDGLLEVKGLPTGFMRIRRVVIETLAKTANHFWNRNDTRSEVPILFERTYNDGIRRGGDISFCDKWRAAGGRIYAVPEMVLGHAAKSIVRDSLAAGLRRQSDVTLAYLVEKIRNGTETMDILREAWRYYDNVWAATEDVLLLCILMARKADGLILETGSGLTTIVMAAANPEHLVYCIEHDPAWAAKTESLARLAGVTNIAIVTAPLVGNWYQFDENDILPGRFALALIDGPPRMSGDRTIFFDRLGDRCETIIADDAQDREYSGWMESWADQNGYRFDTVDDRAALIRRREKESKAA